MEADGSGVTLLTKDMEFNAEDRLPAWSPDGERIAFTSNRPVGEGDDARYVGEQIYVMNADGSGVDMLTNPLYDNRYYGSLSWSPDGQRIAFAVNRDGDSDIYVMNANDGSGVTLLTKDMEVSAEDGSPVWSPDGERIAFISNRPVGEGDDARYVGQQIYVMNADGSGVDMLTNPLYDWEYVDDWYYGSFRYDYSNYLSWSPDGQRIAFAVNRDGDYDIYVMNANDGSGVTPLTKELEFVAEDRSPAWSPDGERIAFTSNHRFIGEGDDARYVGEQIYVMNADGSGVTPLTNLVYTEYDYGSLSWR